MLWTIVVGIQNWRIAWIYCTIKIFCHPLSLARMGYIMYLNIRTVNTTRISLFFFSILEQASRSVDKIWKLYIRIVLNFCRLCKFFNINIFSRYTLHKIQVIAKKLSHIILVKNKGFGLFLINDMQTSPLGGWWRRPYGILIAGNWPLNMLIN